MFHLSRREAACEQLHDYVLFMANTGLRPDEASRLEFRDVAIVTDEATGERILEIEVRGKRGVGYCKSMTGPSLKNASESCIAGPRTPASEVEDRSELIGFWRRLPEFHPQTVLRDWSKGGRIPNR